MNRHSSFIRSVPYRVHLVTVISGNFSKGRSRGFCIKAIVRTTNDRRSKKVFISCGRKRSLNTNKPESVSNHTSDFSSCKRGRSKNQIAFCKSCAAASFQIYGINLLRKPVITKSNLEKFRNSVGGGKFKAG